MDKDKIVFAKDIIDILLRVTSEQTKFYIIERLWLSEAGYPCVVLATDMGHRCGYVGIPKGHPLYALDYLDYNDSEVSIEAHGGVTFAGRGNFIEGDEKNNSWWFGFDCAHYGDGKDPEILEKFNKTRPDSVFDEDGVIRSLEYCISECEHMARQLSEVCPRVDQK